MKLALHTWTLDTTPLSEVARIAVETGWDAVEIRRRDVIRSVGDRGSIQEVVALLRAAKVAVACVGVEMGWMFASGSERARLLTVFDEQCALASQLGAAVVMSPADRTKGPLERAVASVREVGDIARAHGVRVAIEALSQAEQLNTLRVLSELVSRASHPACGLVVDSYHLQRSGDGLAVLERLPPDQIFLVQYSDVPRRTARNETRDRLPPGHGIVPFDAFFRLVFQKRYDWYLSYEAPNVEAWTRPARDVAAEALAASRAVLHSDGSAERSLAGVTTDQP
jgi:sugar phosphate isomerase/epimerase